MILTNTSHTCHQVLTKPIGLKTSRSKKSKTEQPSLFDLMELSPVKSGVVSIRQVPRDLQLAPNRYYICVTDGNDSWQFPLQFALHEAEKILSMIEKFNITLTLAPSGEVVPEDFEAIAAFVEAWIDGGCGHE